MTASWIDNVDFMMLNIFIKLNCQMLQILHTETEIWTHWYTLIFILIKYKLIHFINKLNNHDIFIILILKFHEISLTKICQILNIILNLQLKFEVYVQYIELKTTTNLKELTVIADFIWEFDLRDVQKLYISMIISQIIYCCSVWYIANKVHKMII